MSVVDGDGDGVVSAPGSSTTSADPALPHHSVLQPVCVASESVEDAAREVVRVARLGPDGPTGTFTSWDGVNVPW
ncbi:hypothetical protein [Umezawaea beigongshangensis]|uniref:hypothetical protein n=1 Tax=Umezawaea beigongshangensis TaxID=2780383 RepID=UPI0018F244B5|nr:hypothetical protein [Umezawaea beigongshangensis]